jgi:UPF0755 protein
MKKEDNVKGARKTDKNKKDQFKGAAKVPDKSKGNKGKKAIKVKPQSPKKEKINNKKPKLDLNGAIATIKGRKDKKAPKYKGEIYFSAQTGKQSSQAGSAKKGPKNITQIRQFINSNSKRKAAVYFAAIVLSTVLFSAVLVSCVNDVLAFNRSNDIITVSVPENASTGQIINMLHDEGLIKNKIFCKIFIAVTSRNEDQNYLGGVYHIKAKMGVENMLNEFRVKTQARTVSLSFQEGWTTDKIAERLEKNGVCKAEDFYQTLEQVSFDYSFINKLKDEKDRFRKIEGYLFPDRYDFFIGQNPSSVIRKMLDNFKNKWSDKFSQRAKELGMTVDQVIILASIIQKEAGDTSQMKTISSVLHNRLENPAKYPMLQCDSTITYINNSVLPFIKNEMYGVYLGRYNTYTLSGLPAGPICNPGEDAIEAALYPANTDYFYFCHNMETKEVFLAKTLEEHNENKVKAEITTTPS